MTRIRQSISILLTLLFPFSPVFSQKKSATSGDPEMAKKIARFAPTVLTANTAKLTAKDKLALTRIIQAAKLLDPLFLRQVWSGNDALEKKLLADTTAVVSARSFFSRASLPLHTCRRKSGSSSFAA